MVMLAVNQNCISKASNSIARLLFSELVKEPEFFVPTIENEEELL